MAVRAAATSRGVTRRAASNGNSLAFGISLTLPATRAPRADEAPTRVANVVSRDYSHVVALVGIRQFKAELSRYLREVRRGSSVFVTDRGEVIAEVSKPGLVGRGTGRSSAAARLRAMEERGLLRPPARTDRTWTKGALVRLKPGTARRLLDADRAE